MKKQTKHPPGSIEAKKMGCKCPVLDNSYGRGIMGLGVDWVIVDGCPLHAATLSESES